MRISPDHMGAWINIACSLLVALSLALILRPATAGLTRALGTIWPFSTVHCETRVAPGCDGGEPRPALHTRFGLALP